ncbi:uncharacterized protein PAC_14218 [Phialocephala subalpina]|uniref:DUF6594 domain-containing protein n=1 Tax=Phialocephala subalpina TaxID=576137 RepID=A0A1L7XH08_9HELO|nr:uncharacterized protein PAC_14218 [Phialocephala subalpina]
MSPDVVPNLRRSHSSPGATSIDPYDRAEQGFRVGSSADIPGARQPVEARRTLSLRYSLRSSDSTLAGSPGESYELGSQQRAPLPRQESPQKPAAWISQCFNGIRLPSFPRPTPRNSPADPPDDYKLGYTQFQHDRFEDFPDGWPRLAAFMESSESFGIYRMFGVPHARLLVIHMSNIEEIWTELLEMDRKDAAGGADTNWRLKNRFHEDGLDTSKIILQQRLEAEILAYDTLLEKFGNIKSMSRTPARDHDSLFRYLWANKPLDPHEDDWIYHPDDFVSLVPPRRNGFEGFILRHLDGWPNSCFKKLFQTGKAQHKTRDSEVKFYCTARINTIARLIAVFFAVLVLFIPVILFFLTSMSRAWMAVVVLAFDFIFSVMISLLTDAGDKEIFVGTATYCAVLVTFLGNLQRPER